MAMATYIFQRTMFNKHSKISSLEKRTETSASSEYYSSPTVKVRNALLYFWQVFFNLHFFFLCCPFRLKRKINNGISPTSNNTCYIASTWLPQKILCIACTCVNFLWMIYYTRKSFPKHQDNPSDFLIMAAEVNINLLKISLLKIYWLNRKDLMKVINFLTTLDIPTLNSRNPFLGRLGKTLFAGWGIQVVTFATIHVHHRVTEGGGVGNYGDQFWSRMSNIGRGLFFLNADITKGVTGGNETIFVSDKILSMVVAVTDWNQHLFYSYLAMMTFLPVLTLWSVARSFISQIGAESLDASMIEVVSWPLVKEKYETVKKMMALINSTFGWSFTCVTVEVILYYSTLFTRYSFPNWSDPINIVSLISLIIEVVTMVGTVLLAGDICDQV